MSSRKLERTVAAAPRAHLVGIAGAGMSALADVLRQDGWIVSGSDESHVAGIPARRSEAGVGTESPRADDPPPHAHPLQWVGMRRPFRSATSRPTSTW